MSRQCNSDLVTYSMLARADSRPARDPEYAPGKCSTYYPVNLTVKMIDADVARVDCALSGRCFRNPVCTAATERLQVPIRL